MVLVLEPSEIGIEMEESKLSELPVENVFTNIPRSSICSDVLPLMLLPPLKEQRFATPELAPIINDPTSNAKSKILGKRIRTTKSSPMLEVDSTIRERTFWPFWTESSKEISKLLSLHTETDCADLDSSLWNTSLRNTGLNSWFSVKMKKPLVMEQMNLPQTFFRSSLSLSQSITESVQRKIEGAESVKKPKKKKLKEEMKVNLSVSNKDNQRKEKEPLLPLKSIKIRIYPSPKQKKMISQWMGAARWTYNACRNAIENKTVPCNRKKLRDAFVTKSSKVLDASVNPWLFDTPYDIRDYALTDLLQAYDTNFKKEKFFQIKPRSLKDRQQSITIRSRQFELEGGKYAWLKSIAVSEPIPKLHHDFRLLRTRFGHYYFCIPVPLNIHTENQGVTRAMEHKIIALDPGVRTFQTTFDTEGNITEWGNGAKFKITNLCHLYDNLQSKWSKANVKHKQRYRMKKVGMLIHRRIRNLVDDLHKKLAKWLCENHKVILLPHYETSKMVIKTKRKINSATARAMLTFSHYRFKEHLLFKATEYPGCQVLLVDESYTSITCGSCGKKNKKLGTKETFECPSCNWRAGRDINGARNILVRFLTKVSEKNKWW